MSTDFSTPENLPDFSGLDMDFEIIDSHHHLFGLDDVYYPWLTDHPEPHFLLGDYDAIKRVYLADDLKADFGGLRVVKTVHVEAETDRDDPVKETRWLTGVMAQNDLPSAVVAHAWLDQPDTEAVLEAQASFPAVRGIRAKPVTAPTAAGRRDVTGKPRSLQDETWRRGLGLLRKFGLSWDLRVPYWHLAEAAEVAALYPDLPIVCNHLGLCWDRSDEGLAEWRRGMKALAALENVHLKVSELGLATGPWNYDENRRVVREAIEIFGFERCMYASNYPVAGLRIGYVDQAKAIAHMVADCSADERHALFYGTARAFYRLED